MSTRSRFRTQRAPIVLGVLDDRRSESVFEKAYGEDFVPIAQARNLETRVRGHVVDLIVVSPWDSTGARVAPSVARIARWSRPPVAAYVDRRPASLHELPALFRAGAVDLILHHEDDSPVALRAMRDRGGIGAIGSEAMEIAAAFVPPPMVPLLQHCFVEVCGAWLGIPSTDLRRSRRALSRLAHRADLPGVRETRSRCRVVVAAGLILRMGDSIETTALRLGYESGSALHNLFRRYAGVHATELAKHGDFPHWIRRLLGF